MLIWLISLHRIKSFHQIYTRHFQYEVIPHIQNKVSLTIAVPLKTPFILALPFCQSLIES